MLAVTRHVHYARHFTLLACIAALLIVTSRWRASPGAAYSFAIYGALHASVLAASLRDRQPLVRQILFVAIAALVCMLTARLGLFGMRFAGKLPSFAGPVLLLAAVSGVGALGYGLLIRLFWIRDLSLHVFGITAIFCILAECAALIVGNHYQVLGGLWLAIPWWFAFSAGLCYYEHRRSRR
jgi:hypothetical protein